MKRPVEDGLSLIVGAGVGMALMYLLDPSEGSDRRTRIQQATRDRLAQAGTAASAGLEHLHEAVDRAAHTPTVQLLAARAAEAAKGVYNEFGSHANAAVDAAHQQATDVAGGLHSKIADKIDELRGRANDLKDNAQSRYGTWLNKASLAAGRDEDHHYIGQTACALGSLAIGATAVYLFDAEQGQERRAKIVDRSTYAVKETGEFFRKAGRRLVTRSRVVANLAAEQTQDVISHLRHAEPETQPATESTEASMGT